MNNPQHEKYLAMLLLMDKVPTTLSSRRRRWYAMENNTVYRVIGVYPNGSIAMYNERLLKRALAGEVPFINKRFD